MKELAYLILENGTLFKGTSIGVTGETIGEIVFNTAMTGYQEIVTDPSYKNQIIIFTYPNIGNTGINTVDIESSKIQIKGIIIRNLSLIKSNYRSHISLNNFLKKNNIIGITGIDTRKLTRIIRTEGVQYGCIFNSYKSIKGIYKKIKIQSKLKNNNLIQQVSTTKEYTWKNGINTINNKNNIINKKLNFHIVVYDFGVKYNILRLLVQYGCYVTVVPYNTTIERIQSLHPDGIVLSNGPGDPRVYHSIIKNIKKLFQINIPMLGICLGHQLIALSCKAKIKKMKFGHHGSNHPVQDLKTKKVNITTQNHNFTISKKNLPKKIIITHKSLFDDTIQGIKIMNHPTIGFQGHPEANPGPHDSEFIFKNFIQQIKN